MTLTHITKCSGIIIPEHMIHSIKLTKDLSFFVDSGSFPR